MCASQNSARCIDCRTDWLTDWLTDCVEQSPSSEAYSHSARQEIPRLLQNPKVHYRVHNSTLLVPILSQLYPATPSHPTSLGSILLCYHPRLDLLGGDSNVLCNISFFTMSYPLDQPPNLEDQPLSAVNHCLFSIFASTLHIWSNSRTRHDTIDVFVILGDCAPDIAVWPVGMRRASLRVPPRRSVFTW
jgi:hypothetical protein